MSNINNKLDYLDETKQLIKQAIIEKGQEVSDEDTFRSYVDKISDIETGNDTKDATATSNDILYPETAYISNGKVTGNIIPTYSSNTTLSQTNTINRSLSYSLLDINYDAKIAIVSDEDYKFNFCNIVNNEIDYENSAYITLNDFEEGMDGTYSFSKCCTNFDKNTNDLYLYLLFTFQNTFKVFCYTYNIKTRSSKYIDTYELTIDDANNSLVLNMMIRPNYPNQAIVFCGYTSTTALGSYLTTIFLQFNTVALELQKIEDTISTSGNQYAALVESCYFTSNGEYLCINVRTGTLFGTTQNGIIYHCVNNFLESIVDSTQYVTLFENGNYMAYNQSTRNHCLFNINGDVLHSYSGNLGEVSIEQLAYTNKCILGNYLFGFAYPEDFIDPIEPLILYCCKLNEDYTVTKEYEIGVGSRTLFNCYNAILYDNKTTRNFDGYLGDTEKEIISLERNNTTYFSTKDSTADENDILSPKTAYSNGKKIIGNILTTYDNRNDNISVNTLDIAEVEACEYLYKENMYILGKEQMYILKQDSSSTAYSFENDIEGNIIRITSCYINNHTIIAVLTTNGEKLAYIYFYEMNSDKTLNYLTKLEFTSEQFYKNQMTLRISNRNILAYTIRNRNKGSNYYFYQLKYEDNFSVELISQGVIGSGEIDFYTGKWSKDSTKYIILGQDYRYTGIFNLDNKGTVINTEVSNLFYYFDFHTDDKVCYVNNNILSYCSYTYPFTFEPIFSINVTNNDWLNLFVLKDWCILYGKTKVQIYKIEANKFVHLYEFDSYYARLKDLNQINDKVYNLNKSTKALTVLYDEGISVIDSVTIKDKVLYNTDLADATMNDVLQGKIFYNSKGKQIGNKIFTDYNDSVGVLETNSAISVTAVDQLIGVEMLILPDIEYLDKVKVNDIIKAVITIIDVATSSATLKCNCLVQILEIIDHSDKQFKANVRILAADVNTEDGTATSEDIAEGKIAYVDNKRIHGSVILPEEHTTEQQSGLSILEIASPGTVNVDNVHRTSCMVKNRLISVSNTNISIYDMTNSTSKSFSLTDLIGSTFNTNVISIGANNPNNIGSDYYYILLSNLSNKCYLLLYNYIENKIYSRDDNDINGCKCVISFAPGSNNRIGIIAEKHNKIAFTYEVALNAGGSSGGQVYLGTIDYVKGLVRISEIFNSDGFWAAFPVWYNNDKALATSTFFNSSQWNGEKRIFLFDEDINTYTTITLQGRRAGQSQGFTFSSDLSLCMRGLDLYKVNYVESARTLSLSLLKEDALQLDGYTESDTHYQTTPIRFSKDNQFLIVKDTSTTVKLFAIDDEFNWNLLSSYNTEACNFLTNSIDTDQDLLCTSGNINNIISIDITQDRQSYMTYNNKTYYSYIDCGLTTSKSQVLSNIRFLGSTGIERGTMPNNGNLTYTPSENKQSIPAGYTSGGTILPYNITQSQDYQSCLSKVNLILGDSFIQYKQIEYIETSGTQYIDTDIIINKTMKLIIKYIPMLISGGQCLLGGTNTNDHWYAAGYNAHNNCSGGQILGTNITITESVKTEVVTLTLNDNNTIKYQSDTINVSKSISYNNSSYTLKLFNSNRYNEKGNIRFYSLEIYNQNNELIHNLVPVINLITDECMLQDTITDKKYTNSGSGKFIQGGIK